MVEPVMVPRDSRRAGVILLLAATAFAATFAVRHRAERISEAPPAPLTAAAPQADVTTLERRLNAHPDDGAGWRALGQEWFARSRYSEAARAYARAATLDPGDAAIWSALGEAHTLAVDAVDDEAATAFGKALAIDPGDARARYFIAVAKDVAGDHRAAIADWTALLRDAPLSAPWAPSVRTLIRQIAARHHLALPADLPDAGPAAARGEAVATAGIPGPTAEQLGDAVRLSPTQQDAMAHEMVDMLASRLARDPQDADGWIRLMRARLVLGDSVGARRALADAHRVFAADPATRARLTDAGRVLGVADD